MLEHMLHDLDSCIEGLRTNSTRVLLINFKKPVRRLPAGFLIVVVHLSISHLALTDYALRDRRIIWLHLHLLNGISVYSS